MPSLLKAARVNALWASCFIYPRYKFETEAGRSFTGRSIKEWNSLPVEVRRLPSVKSFKPSLFLKALENQTLLYLLLLYSLPLYYLLLLLYTIKIHMHVI